MKLVYKLIFLFLLCQMGYSYASSDEFFRQECKYNKSLQNQRSKELQKLYNADQNERKNIKAFTNNMDKILKADQNRRIRVGEIFGEGCINSASDYIAAGMIYQHGDIPDQYFQAYIWFNEAAKLGNSQAKKLMALAIDRYLVSINQKQLFGTQMFSLSPKQEIFCVQPVEESFPESIRREYLGQTMKEQIEQTSAYLDMKHSIITYCDTHLAPSPKGSLPGFW